MKWQLPYLIQVNRRRPPVSTNCGIKQVPAISLDVESCCDKICASRCVSPFSQLCMEYLLICHGCVLFQNSHTPIQAEIPNKHNLNPDYEPHWMDPITERNTIAGSSWAVQINIRCQTDMRLTTSNFTNQHSQ